MPSEDRFLNEVACALEGEDGCSRALGITVRRFRAQNGTIHVLEDDGILHLKAASGGIPDEVLKVVTLVPRGKGMAGLAFERKQPVSVCNIQTDRSGSVRPGARATGMQGALVVPILDGSEAVGAIGIGSQVERQFTEDEAALLTEVGRLIALKLKGTGSVPSR